MRPNHQHCGFTKTLYVYTLRLLPVISLLCMASLLLTTYVIQTTPSPRIYTHPVQAEFRDLSASNPSLSTNRRFQSHGNKLEEDADGGQLFDVNYKADIDDELNEPNVSSSSASKVWRSRSYLKESTLLDETKETNIKSHEVTYNVRKPQKEAGPLTAVIEDPYEIENSHVCQNPGNVRIVFLVHSATRYHEKRYVIRETWGQKAVLSKLNMALVFLLGQPATEDEQEKLVEENAEFGDIVQGHFRDTYHNLTLKAVLGLRWVKEHCSNSSVVVKLDDDMFVNLEIFRRYFVLSRIKSLHSFMFCQVRPKGTSVISRGKADIWYVEDSIFPNMTMYPVTYCNGFAVVYSTSLLKQMYEKTKETPFFWIDDVYVYGMLTDKVGNVMFTDVDVSAWDVESNRCFLSKDCDMMVGKADVEHMYMFWENFLKYRIL